MIESLAIMKALWIDCNNELQLLFMRTYCANALFWSALLYFLSAF